MIDDDDKKKIDHDDRWRRAQRRLDEMYEAERVARNRRTDAAVVAALADPSRVPVMVRGDQRDEPTCPACGRYNAMLWRATIPATYDELLICRDCFTARRVTRVVG